MKTALLIITISQRCFLLLALAFIAGLPFIFELSTVNLLWLTPSAYLVVFLLHLYLDHKLMTWHELVHQHTQGSSKFCALKLCPLHSSHK